MEAIANDINNELKRIAIEVDAIARKCARLDAEKDHENIDSHLTAIASIIQSVYNGYERTLEMLIRTIDGELPAARDYHTALLRRASSEIPDVRPPIISEKTFQVLDDIRKYRHVFRKIYHYQLRPEKVKGFAGITINSFDMFKGDVNSFLKRFMEGK